MNSYEIILYVADQQRSREFYSMILEKSPSLDVPGMTEFDLLKGLKLGLMPEENIVKILGDKTPEPKSGSGIPRCELYLGCADPGQKYALALRAGAKEISPVQDRDWGASVGYVADPDGHVIAFAKELKKTKSGGSFDDLLAGAKLKAGSAESRSTRLWEELDEATAERLAHYFLNDDEIGFCYYHNDDQNWTVLSSQQVFGKKNGEFCCFALHEIKAVENAENGSEISVQTTYENQAFDMESGNPLMADALESFCAAIEPTE